MWTRTYTQTYHGVKREDIWRIWTDMSHWPTWHDDLASCTLEGDFEVGSYFFLTPKGMKTFKIKLVEVHEGYSFTDCTSFFGAKRCIRH